MVILSSHSPMTKIRVLYIGSAVPLDTATGLDAIQGPLKERYPTDVDHDIEGIDAILSVTNECIQMQYVNDPDQIVQFPVSSLTMCAAVRCVSAINTATGETEAKFVSLNDPLAGGDNALRPSIFAAVTRRTKGRKVLECHGFICTSPQDSLNLVKCASIAGKNYKQHGTIKSNRPIQQSVETNGTTDPLLDAGSTLNRLSNGSAFTPPPNVQNGETNGTAMRLIPGEPVAHVTAGPEFFEPVSTQGYFYSSNNAEVKKYNISKIGGRNKENIDVNQTASNERHPPTITPINGYTPTPTPRQAPVRVVPSRQPVYVRLPHQHYATRPPMPPPPPMMPMYYRPPPPPTYARPMFFSPPPPRFRPQPYMMPPGAPPPMMAPPIFVRRPRGGSAGSGSRSHSSDSRVSRRSRDSRSKTPVGPVNGDETQPKRIPNADESSEDSEIRVLNRQRPSTPPTDYDDRRKGERMSRRDAYEVKYGVEPAPYRYGPRPDVVPPYGYDYYVQPPRHGGYAPFTMYNPHARSRSVPAYDRQRSKSPRKKGKKKNKKTKKSKQHKQKPQYVYYPKEGYKRHPAHSDVSTDSFAGYHSEMPRANRNGDPTSGYQFYPPRDFRRDENQHMNERNFSKSIKEETRRSRDSKAYPTAYELNEALNRGGADRTDDADFTMY